MSLMALMTGLGTPPAVITYLFDVGSSGGGGGGSAVRYKSWAFDLLASGATGGTVRVTLQTQVGGERPIERRYYTEGDTSVEILMVPESSDGGIYPIAEDADVTFVMRQEGADEAAINAAGSVTNFRDAGGTVRRALLFTFDDDNPMPDAGKYSAYFVVDGAVIPLGKTIPITVQEALS